MKPPTSVVLVIGGETSLEVPARMVRVLKQEGLTIQRVDEESSSDAVPAWLDDDPLPSAVLLMEDLTNPLAVARRVHSLAPLVQIVFIAGEDRAARLRNEIVGIPRIGRHWSIIDPDHETMHRSLIDAVKATRQRLNLRTTLDRLNLKIQQQPPAIDTTTYRKLVVSDRYLASVLEHAGDAILAVDRHHRITTWNLGAEHLFGYDEVAALEREVDMLVPVESRSELLALVREALDGKVAEGHELECLRIDGSRFSAAVTVAPLWGEEDWVDSVVVIARDVTERNRAEAQLLAANERLERALERLEATKHELLELNAQLKTQATTDALTGLKNRSVFHNSLTEMIAVAERSGSPLSLLLADVDHFKSINDRWGHLEGDRVLKKIAEELKSVTRDQDVIARFGGEEFAVLLPNTALDDAMLVGEKLRACCVDASENVHGITVSLGAAAFEAGDTDVTLIDRADRALYAAKEAGRNRVVRADKI